IGGANRRVHEVQSLPSVPPATMSSSLSVSTSSLRTDAKSVPFVFCFWLIDLSSLGLGVASAHVLAQRSPVRCYRGNRHGTGHMSAEGQVLKGSRRQISSAAPQ